MFSSSHAVAGNILRPLLVGPEYILRDVDAFSSKDMLRPPDALHEPGQLDSSPLLFRQIAVLESPVADREGFTRASKRWSHSCCMGTLIVIDLFTHEPNRRIHTAVNVDTSDGCGSTAAFALGESHGGTQHHKVNPAEDTSVTLEATKQHGQPCTYSNVPGNRHGTLLMPMSWFDFLKTANHQIHTKVMRRSTNPCTPRTGGICCSARHHLCHT